MQNSNFSEKQKNIRKKAKTPFCILMAFILCIIAALCLRTIFGTSEEIKEETENNVKKVMIPSININTYSLFKHNRDSFIEGLTFDSEEVLYETGGRYNESKLFKYKPDYNAIYEYSDNGFWEKIIFNVNNSKEEDKKEEKTETENNNRKVIEFENEVKNEENNSDEKYSYTLDEDSISYFPEEYFVEGMAYKEGYLYILTWKEHKIFKYKIETEKVIKTANYDYEGWGLTCDGDYFYASDGSDKIHIYEISDDFHLKEIITLEIKDEEDNPLININELEYVNGYLMANIWKTNDVVLIDINKEKVIDRYNFDFLQENEDDISKEMNGIAYDKMNKIIYFTGKYWNWIYGFKVNEKELA